MILVKNFEILLENTNMIKWTPNPTIAPIMRFPVPK